MTFSWSSLTEKGGRKGDRRREKSSDLRLSDREGRAPSLRYPPTEGTSKSGKRGGEKTALFAGTKKGGKETPVLRGIGGSE